MDYVDILLGSALAAPLLVSLLYFFGVGSEYIVKVRAGEEISLRQIAVEAIRGYMVSLMAASLSFFSVIGADILAGNAPQSLSAQDMVAVVLSVLAAASYLTIGFIGSLVLPLARRELPRILESMRAELNAKKTLQD